MSEPTTQIERILAKLAEVRARRPDTFGSGSHGYALGPPLSEEAVRAFEVERGVTLPDGYRRFVTQVGHGGPGRYGGAGPYYGLYALDNWDEYHDWVGMTDDAEFLLRPCPLQPGHNELPGDDEDLDDDDWPGPELRQMYDGILTIGTRGCSYMTGLIVSGPWRGRVVYVDASHLQLPYVGRDADFLAWYERWLDELLSGVDTSWFGYGPAGNAAPLLDLIEATSDRDLRLEAVRNVGRAPALDDAVWTRLRPLLRSEDGELRAAATSAFATAPPAYADAVGPLLADPDEEVRRTACSVVLALDASRYTARVRCALFDDPSLRVRTDAFFALRRLGTLGQDDMLAIVSDTAMGELRSAAAYHVEWTVAHRPLLDVLAQDPNDYLRRIATDARGALDRD